MHELTFTCNLTLLNYAHIISTIQFSYRLSNNTCSYIYMQLRIHACLDRYCIILLYTLYGFISLPCMKSNINSKATMLFQDCHLGQLLKQGLGLGPRLDRKWTELLILWLLQTVHEAQIISHKHHFGIYHVKKLLLYRRLNFYNRK